MNRPLGVTVAGWTLVAAGGIALAGLPFRLANTEFERMLQTYGWTLWLSLALVAVASAVNFAAGVAILNERNWGRLLYLWFTPAALFVEWIFLRGQTDVCSSWWEIVLYIALFVLLTRPDAQAWFGAPLHPHHLHRAGPSRGAWFFMAAAGATLAVAATLVWALGLYAYAAVSFTEGATGAFRQQFSTYVLPPLATAPLFGLFVGVYFAHRPPTLLATPFIAAVAAVLNHSVLYIVMLATQAPPGEPGMAMLVPFLGVFLGATAAPLWIPAAFLLRSFSLRLKRKDPED